jgi:dihydroneopterin aldolase
MNLEPGLRRVFVRDLVLVCRIGVGKEERARPQRVRLDLDLLVEEGSGPVDDALESVVDYSALVRRARAVVAQGPVRLVETLAERLAAAAWFDPRIRRVRVRVEKPDVIDDAGAVGVEIERLAPAHSMKQRHPDESKPSP